MAPPRALLLAALLAATTGLVLCQANVKTTVVEDALKRVTLFPNFKVAGELLRLIPLQNGVPAGQQMRNNHRLIYRGDLPFADAKRVCLELSKKKKTTITATKKGLKETVDVLAATQPCARNQGMSGASPRVTFMVLIKRRTTELDNSFTVLRCAAGARECQLWRLGRPCPGGRCSLEPDPSLSGSVFSEVPTCAALRDADPEAAPFVLEDMENAAQNPNNGLLILASNALEIGVGFDTPGAVKEAQDTSTINISFMADLSKDEAVTSKLDCGQWFDLDRQAFREQATGNRADFELLPGDVDLTNPDTGGAAAASILAPAFTSKFSLAFKTGLVNFKACPMPTFFAQINTYEKKMAAKCIQERGSGAARQCESEWINKLSAQYVADCMASEGRLPLGCRSRLGATEVVNYMSSLAMVLHENVLGSSELKTRGRIYKVPRGACLKKSELSRFASASAAGLNGTTLEDPNFLGAIFNGLRSIVGNLGISRIAQPVVQAINTGKKEVVNKVVTPAGNVFAGVLRFITSKIGRRLLQAGTDPASVIKNALATYGQILVHISPEVLQFYGSGVINPATCTCKIESCFNHGVHLVGYDDDEGVWILENLTGDIFGEAGTFKLGYSDVDEFGPCGLYSYLSTIIDIKEA